MDEVSNTYIGRFILTNGVDLYGQRFPLFYSDKFHDYPPVLPMYLSGITSFFFGLNELSARLPAAFFGSLIVVPLYFLLKKYSKVYAFLVIGIVSIFPWHVFLSRASSEGIMALTAGAFGFLFLFNGIIEGKKWKIFISWIFFGLTYLLYPSFRILMPLVFFPLPFLFKDKKIRVSLIVSFIIFTLLTGLIGSTQWGRGRLQQTSLFSNPTDRAIIVNDITALSNDDGNNYWVARIFHNKAVQYGRRVISQYLSYFSPEFLYSKDSVPRRYNVTGAGIMYLSFIFLIVLFFIFRKVKVEPSYYTYIIYLLFIAPIPAAITVDDFPNVHRSLFMILPLTLLIGLGILNAYNLISPYSKRIKYGIIFCLSFLLITEIVYTSHQYYAHAGSFEIENRNIGSLELGKYLAEHHRNYERIILTEYDWLSIYYLFAQNNFDKTLASQFKNDFRINKLDNIEFVEEECPTALLHGKDFLKNTNSFKSIYFVDKGGCKIPSNFDTVASIKKKDGTEAFRILHTNSPSEIFKNL